MEPNWDITYNTRRGEVLKVRVKEATVADNSRKLDLEMHLISQFTSETEGGAEVLGQSDYITVIGQYPLIVTCTEEVENIPWPLTLQDFMALPSALVLEWVALCKEVNPQYNLPFLATLNLLNSLKESENASAPTPENGE